MSNFEIETTRAIVKALEQIAKDNREYLEFAKERDERALQIQEAHLRIEQARYVMWKADLAKAAEQETQMVLE